MSFELRVGDLSFKSPIAISSIAGVTDASFGNLFSDFIGAVFLGGFSIDERTTEASRKIASRGRKEFLYEDPLERISEELEKVDRYVPGVNVRVSERDALLEVAELCAEKGAILEINAHCRQREMIEAGAGEALLRKPEILEEWVRDAKRSGAVISVKFRTGVVDEVALARRLERAGADILHVDAMAPEGADLEAIRKIRNATNVFIIGNNSVRSFSHAKEMFGRGANMVSLARAVLEDSSAIRRIYEEWKTFSSEIGWFDAPKHLCRGGDLRALAFCCPFPRSCPLGRTLKELGVTEETYISVKRSFAEMKGIEDDSITCFGNLVWCCKITKPCAFRDALLIERGISKRDYMEMKRELSNFILGCLRDERD